MTKHINDLIASRRAVLGGLVGMPLLSLAGCATSGPAAPNTSMNFTSVAATNADTVSLPPGYSFRTLIAWGDALFDTVSTEFDPDTLTRAEQEQRFGQNCDMLAALPYAHSFPPPRDGDRMILCVNNEYASAELMFPALERADQFSTSHLETLFAAVGVSVVEMERDGAGWRALKNAAPGQGFNRRITPFTPMRITGPAAQHPWVTAASAVFNANEPGAPDRAVACGTMQNCAGGTTPWGTFLSAEENFDSMFAGTADDLTEASRDSAFADDVKTHGYPARYIPSQIAPAQFAVANNPYGPALFGWIVEIDPYDPASTPKKRTALGRKKNECANTAITMDGRVAVYTGDDESDQHLYKFVTRGRFAPNERAANMDLLDDGDLYAAQFLEAGRGRWLKLTVDAANAAAEATGSPIRFADHGDLVMRVRYAARLMGATPMDRPEDVEPVIDANWRGDGTVIVACTKTTERAFDSPGNPRRESNDPTVAQENVVGHILRLDEANGDNGAEHFTWGVFALCGDPDAETLVQETRDAGAAHVSVAWNGQPTFTGDRFACPDNILIDSTRRVWIATDGNDGVFRDCNDSVLVAPADAVLPRPVKRFLIGPVGAEICGPLMTPDERAFMCCIQHPGGNTIAGVGYWRTRWTGAPPPSNFPDGGQSWPRSAVVVVTRNDGGRIGD